MVQFSVVIPLYNKAAHVEQTLNSVLSQTRLPDEIIVVDDGSTDNGGHIIEKKFGDLITVIRQENSGVSSARNTGIGHASFDYVCLLDADDEWMPGYLSELCGLIDDFPEALFYSCRRFFCDENGKYLPAVIGVNEHFRGIVADFADTFSRGYGLISSSSVCFRRSFFTSGVQFPWGEMKGEDLYYWLRLGLSGQLAFSAKPLVKICLNADNRSTDLVNVVPYHLRWYLASQAEIGKNVKAYSVRKFIIKNTLVFSYGLAASGDRNSAFLVTKTVLRAKELWGILLIPSLFFPSTGLKIIKYWRRKIRKKHLRFH